MICFEVHINGKRLCIAGVGGQGVLTTIVDWVGRKKDYSANDESEGCPLVYLRVGGLYDREPEVHVHPEWATCRLRPGDEITVRIVESDSFDPPKEEKIHTESEILEQQRAYYLSVKAKFEPEAPDAIEP